MSFGKFFHVGTGIGIDSFDSGGKAKVLETLGAELALWRVGKCDGRLEHIFT